LEFFVLHKYFKTILRYYLTIKSETLNNDLIRFNSEAKQLSDSSWATAPTVVCKLLPTKKNVVDLGYFLKYDHRVRKD